MFQYKDVAAASVAKIVMKSSHQMENIHTLMFGVEVMYKRKQHSLCAYDLGTDF